MIERDILLTFLDEALDPEARARVEAQLTHDREALGFLVEQRKLDRLLRSTLRPESVKQRLKQSILAAVRASAPGQLRASVLEKTISPPVAPGESHWERAIGYIQRLNALTSLRSRRYAAAAATLIALGIATFLLLRPSASAPVAIGKFATVIGSPTLRHAGQRSTLYARPSTTVRLGDRIETGDADKAEIQFNDGTTLRLDFNTALEIPGPKSRSKNTESPPLSPHEVKLSGGQVWAKVQKTTNAPQFAVQTPVATAAVKGTEFGLKLHRAITNNAPRGERGPLLATLTVSDGVVEFFNALGTVRATAMTESVAQESAAPTQPKRVAQLKTFRLTRTYLGVANGRLKLTEAEGIVVYPFGWLGLNLSGTSPAANTNAPQPLPSTNMVRVSRVLHGSPAEQAGLQVSDLITAVDGQPVTNKWHVLAAMLSGPNRPITLTLTRTGRSEVVSLTTSRAPFLPPLPLAPAEVQGPLYAATWERFAAAHQTGITREQTAAGEPSLEDLARSYPNVAAVHHNLAFLYEARDEMGDAIRLYRRAVELDPETALYHFNFGMALRSIGNLDRALEELETTARLAPAFAFAWRWLADVYTMLDRSDQAVAAIDAGIQISPLDARLWMHKAEVLLRSRQPDAALAAVLKAIELEPTLPDPHIELGSIYDDLGRIDEAEAAHRRAIAMDPDPSENSAYIDLANILRAHRGQLDEAEALYRKALEMSPDDSNALTGLGSIFHDRRQPAEAEKWLRRAVEGDPNSPTTWNGLGAVLLNLGRLDEAEPNLRKALELEPGYALAYYNLGLLHIRRKQWNEAEAMLLRATELDPSMSLDGPLVYVYKAQGKLDEAEQALRRSLEKNTNNAAALNDLAWHLAERAIKLDEALTLAKRAVELAPDKPDLPNYLDTLGWVHYQRGELDEAEKILQKAIALSADAAAGIREHLKTVQEKKGKPAP